MVAAVVSGIVVSGVAPGFGQDDWQTATLDSLTARLDAQAAEIRQLQHQLDRRNLASGPPSIHRPVNPWVAMDDISAGDAWHTASHATTATEVDGPSFFADYDNGFAIRPFRPDRHPFELKVNGWIQFRHHGFARDVTSWTDNAGVTRQVRNRNAFDVERGRLILSGFALDQRLTYFLHLDGDTDGGHAVDFFDYWWAWEFSDRFQLQMGKRKVPASRQWLLTARSTRFVERPLANDFFRPDRTVGLFGIGRVGDRGHYEVMVGNGYQSANVPNSATDDQWTFAATNYFDLLGNYGGQIVDYDNTCDPRLRIGHSIVYSPNTSESVGVPLEETAFLRLADGTRLTQAGALAPRVTVSEYDLYLYGVDLAMKWRGWSLNAEAFFRWIEQIRGNGPLPVTDLLQRGFYVEGGHFIIPQTLDWNVRYSQVSGLFGDASEYAAGFNWYPLDTANMKISFDVTLLDGSPLQNTASDILVGDDGILVRTQFQAEF